MPNCVKKVVAGSSTAAATVMLRMIYPEDILGDQRVISQKAVHLLLKEPRKLEVSNSLAGAR
jgi:hypothetical protein